MILYNIMKCLFKPRNFLLFSDKESAWNFTESEFPAFVSSWGFFPIQQQVGIECTKETSDQF